MAGRTFLELAPNPQIFHVAILTASSAFGANCMCTGNTLFVGCPFGASSPSAAADAALLSPALVFAFFATFAFEGPASSSSSSAALRFAEVVLFAAGRLELDAFASSTVSLKSSPEGESSESLPLATGAARLVDAARFGGILESSRSEALGSMG